MLYDTDLSQKIAKLNFLNYFQRISTALAKYKEDIRISCTEDEFTHLMADRNVVTDFWVFHFHAQFMEKRYGTINGVDAYQRAEQWIKNYNEKHGLELAKIVQTEQGETIVAACDLFSQCVHENLPQAGDIILVDANLDRQDKKLVRSVCCLQLEVCLLEI